MISRGPSSYTVKYVLRVRVLTFEFVFFYHPIIHNGSGRVEKKDPIPPCSHNHTYQEFYSDCCNQEAFLEYRSKRSKKIRPAIGHPKEFSKGTPGEKSFSVSLVGEVFINRSDTSFLRAGRTAVV